MNVLPPTNTTTTHTQIKETPNDTCLVTNKKHLQKNNTPETTKPQFNNHKTTSITTLLGGAIYWFHQYKHTIYWVWAAIYFFKNGKMSVSLGQSCPSSVTSSTLSPAVFFIQISHCFWRIGYQSLATKNWLTLTSSSSRCWIGSGKCCLMSSSVGRALITCFASLTLLWSINNLNNYEILTPIVP